MSAWKPLLVLLLLTACQPHDPPPTDPAAAEPTASEPSATSETNEADDLNAARDHHSFANPDEISVTHLDLEATVDFDQRVLRGTAWLNLQRHDPLATTLVLDTRDLTVEQVISDAQDELTFEVGEGDDALGAPLTVSVPQSIERIGVVYVTSPAASGLQWLDPIQTAGGQHPFMFSQAQAIHARSFVPLQDTPQARITYNATITTPPELRAVMSASNALEKSADGVYRFEMPQAIPSYLLAIAAGDIEFRAMSERTGVFAEPSVVAAAAAEFADTEHMMEVSETLFGPYRWGRYDLLILPPSFPFGGMENPRLSFITPTVIAGDRSLVALIAHELAHSWSGNLVTNATWRDLWLNEGFTVYLESRIMEAVFGMDRKRMEDVLGYQSLMDDLASVPEADQRLAPDLRGRDPDDAFSNVPYEKGRLLLVMLEHAFNRETFDRFLRQYFDEHAFQSLTTDEFLSYLDQNLLQKYPGKVTRAEVERWVNEPGLPDAAVLPESDAFTKVDDIRTQWAQGAIAAAEFPADQWTVHEWLYFLNNLPEDLAPEKLVELDNAHQLTASTNNEIAHSWLRLAVAHHYQPALPRLREYLATIGRRKLIVPLYEDLMATDWGRPLATEVYAEARPGYHPLAQGTVDGIVGKPE